MRLKIVDRDEMEEGAVSVQEMLISLSLVAASAFEYSPIFAMRPAEWPRSRERGLHFDKEG